MDGVCDSLSGIFGDVETCQYYMLRVMVLLPLNLLALPLIFYVLDDLRMMGNILGTNVLLVTAHPDDECMFFGPIMAGGNEDHKIHLLCLSTGNCDGLGDVRSKELENAVAKFGIPRENLRIIDDPLLEDGFGSQWPEHAVIKHVKQAISDWNIDTIVTFDDAGASHHPNHIAVYNGIRAGCKSGQLRLLAVWLLQSVPTVRKYLGIFDAWFTEEHPRKRCFVSTSAHRSKIRQAMRQHKSQMVWFRQLYIYFSRFMFFNDLVPIMLSQPGRTEPRE